jgi:hypothetical protein
MPPPAMPPPSVPPPAATRANPAAVAAGLAGGVVLVISVFLALAGNTTTFYRIADNTLIQHGGWPLVVLGVAAVLAAIRSTATGKPRRRTFLVLGLLAIALVVYVGTDKSLRTVYPILNGAPDASQPGTVASVGIGVYVAAVGAGLVLLASLFGPIPIAAANAVTPPSLAESRSYPPPPVEPTKKCPDCAETILRDAHVCKHCGYRFGPASPPTT